MRTNISENIRREISIEDKLKNFDIDDDIDELSKIFEEIYKENIDKPSNKNTLWCDNCNDNEIIEDTSLGIYVCKTCGIVLNTILDSNPEWRQYDDDNKKDMNRCSLPISKLLPQSSIATSIGGSCSSRIKKLHDWSSMPYKERSRNEVFKKITQKCAEGKIMKCIEDDAKIMYNNICDCKHLTGKNKGKNIIIRGINRESLIAACVLHACRKKYKTRSPKEIAKIFGLVYTDITRGNKLFRKLAKLKQMELSIKPTSPEHFILRFCDELKMKKEYIDQAIKISNNVIKLSIASVHTPLSLATGSIFLMIQLNKLNIQKKTIADKFNVSQVTISKAYKKLEPFINILTNDLICDKLGIEINNYKEKVEVFDYLKPKFVRFGIDLKNNLNALNKETNLFNEDLLLNHTYEIDIKNKQIENEYIRINLEHIDKLYELYKKDYNLLNKKL